MKFGLEYETCFKVPKKMLWTEGIFNHYVPILNHSIIDNPVLRKWAKDTFESTVLIVDDENKLYKCNFDTIDITHETFNEDLIHTYKYPLITIDSTVVCHLTGKKYNEHTLHRNYSLPNTTFTINLEIVSQILDDDDDLMNFVELFIHSFTNRDLYIVNKSQGVHLNIDVSKYNKHDLLEIILKKYIPWEQKNKRIVRPHNSVWAIPLDEEDIRTRMEENLENLFSKTSSIRYKDRAKVLEFRILSPYADQDGALIKYIKELMNMFSMESNEITPTGPTGGAGKGGSRKIKKSIKLKRRRKIHAAAKTKKRAKKQMEGITIFVYGTLRKGLQNHGILEAAKYSGIWKTVDTYFMVGLKSGSYPYVTTEQLDDSLFPTQIQGELYIVPPELLAVLDGLEGHPHQYKRHTIDIQNSKHETTTAHMYILESDDIKDGIKKGFHRRFVAVNGGDWVKHLESL